MNPLLEQGHLPAFDRVQAKHLEPAVDQIIISTRQRVEQLLQSAPPYSWESLLAPLKLAPQRLHQVWSPVNHLNAVVTVTLFALKKTEFSTVIPGCISCVRCWNRAALATQWISKKRYTAPHRRGIHRKRSGIFITIRNPVHFGTTNYALSGSARLYRTTRA